MYNKNDNVFGDMQLGQGEGKLSWCCGVVHFLFKTF